ncbi:MAG TPA: AsmA family protein [Rhodocyclaceae bacterium]|nr:AsmA family protein [Rhodocyclaceae bacterium]
MKAIRLIGIALAVLLVLVAGAVVYLAAAFDAERIKSELARVVLENKQRRLTVAGALELSFWPNLGVKTGKVTLSERGSEKEFAALESARISVAVLPLLSKQLVVDTVEFAGLQVRLIRHKDGRFNFDDLLSKDAKKSEMVRFDVTGLKVSGAQVSYVDEGSGHTAAVTELDLSTGRLANAASGPLALSLRVKGGQPRTDAAVDLRGDYRYDLDRQEFAIAKLEARAKGEAGGITGLDLMASAGALEAKPASRSLQVEALKVAARGKAGTDSFDAVLEAPRLAVTPEKAGGDTLTLSARLSGTGRNVAAKLGLAQVEGSARAVRVGKLSLDLDARIDEASVKGRLDSSLAADPSAMTVALEKFAGEFDVAHPRMPMQQLKLPVSGSLRADLAKRSAVGQMATRFDETRIALRYDVARFAPLAFGFDLDVDRLNVDKYLPPGKAEEKKPGGEPKIDLGALKSLDLHGTVKVGSLQVANVKVSNLRLEARAAGGRLDVAPLTADLYEGTLAGNVSLNADGNAVALRQNLAGIRINPLMKDALNKDLLEGRGNVVLDVTSRGDTATAMKKALGGTASLALKDGAIKGINLAQTFREAKARISGKQDAVQNAKTADKTDFSELTASFRIAGGVAHNEDLAAKSPFLRLAGSGDIDVGSNAMNYVAKASVVNTSGGQGGKDLEHLRGLTVPVRVTGPFDNLSYKLEFGNLVAEAAKAKVEEKKQEIQQKAKEQVQDKLKGLFRK